MGMSPLCGRTSPLCDPSLLWPQSSPSAARFPPRRGATADITTVPRGTGAPGVGGLHDPPGCTRPPPLLLDLLYQRHAVTAQPRPTASFFAPFPSHCPPDSSVRTAVDPSGLHVRPQTPRQRAAPPHNAAVWGRGGPVGARWNSAKAGIWDPAAQPRFLNTCCGMWDTRQVCWIHPLKQHQAFHKVVRHWPSFIDRMS